MAGKIIRAGRLFEDLLVALCLGLLAVLLIAEVVARKFFNTGLPHSTAYIQHLVLAATFIAAAVTSREKRHLSLAIDWKMSPSVRAVLDAAAAVFSASLSFAFALCALSFAGMAFGPGEKIGFLPKRLMALVMVAGFLLMGVRFVAGLERKKIRIWIAAAAVVLGAFFSFGPLSQILGSARPTWVQSLAAAGEFLQPILAFLTTPLIVLLIVMAFFGVPIFIVLGGIGFFLFAHIGQTLEIIPNQAYTVLTGHAIPAIPLFAVVGFLLSESKAGERMVRFFQALFGWIPGGLTVMAVLVCAFFTTFTGSSGVTILALGGLLSYILIDAGYPKRFAVGLLTASGSIGLLFPPSLPVIIYGVTAQTSIKDMFVGGIIPGFILVLSVAGIGVVYSVRKKIPRPPFQPRLALASFGQSAWELILPVGIFSLYFGGITNLQESAGLAVLYTAFVEMVVKRDLGLKDLRRVVAKCVPIIGGVLIILALANGLSYYIIDAQIPTRLSAWVESSMMSKYVFLLLLNLALLLVGCFMDIYSAILVVVPLIIPLGQVFGIDPVHLGVIFLANLELGYLTPPVGMNLFLASYRFNEPMPRVYRDVLPFMAVRILAVLLITYLPFLTRALL